MVWILVFSFICLFQNCLCCCPNSNDEDEYLPPTSPFLIKFHPYIVFILSKSSDTYSPDQVIRRCAGTLVAPKWIVTASECIVSKDLTEVTLGSGDWSNPSVKTGITSYIRHPDYAKGKGEPNIALVEIPPVDFSNNETLKREGTHTNLELASLMKTEETVPYNMYIACGWSYECDGSLATLLRCLPAVVIPDDECPRDQPLNKMCVVGSGIPEMGDPGMPLLWDNKMIGMSVSHRTCDEKYAPYLVMSQYWDWIQKTTGIEN